jgi:single-strand DNA-binding protein
MNVVVLIGRLVRDPEMRTTTSGKSVCDFSIAVQKRSKPTNGEPDADFFRVNCWDKTAEFVSNYLHKGRLVAVEGRLQSRKYTASDGSTREVVEVVANGVQSLDRPKDDDQGNAPTAGGADSARTARPTAPSTTNVSADEYDPFSDD